MGEALLEDGPAATASAALVTEAWRASSVLAHVTGGLSYGPYANEILSELRDIHTDLQGVHNALQPLRSLDATITEWLLLLPKDVTTEVDIRTISTQLFPLWLTLQQLLRVLDQLYSIGNSIRAVTRALQGIPTRRGRLEVTNPLSILDEPRSKRPRPPPPPPPLPPQSHRHRLTHPEVRDTPQGYRLLRTNWYRQISKVPKWQDTTPCHCVDRCRSDSCTHRYWWTECTHHECTNNVIQKGKFPSVAIRTSTFGDTTLPARIQGLESAAPAAPPPPAHE